MYEIIDKSALKPGDVVGVRLKTKIGWGFFRYPKTIPVTIKRITPARTKFVTTDGREFGKHDSFYHITSETNRHTHVAICAERIYRFERIENRLALVHAGSRHVEAGINAAHVTARELK